MIWGKHSIVHNVYAAYNRPTTKHLPRERHAVQDPDTPEQLYLDYIACTKTKHVPKIVIVLFPGVTGMYIQVTTLLPLLGTIDSLYMKGMADYLRSEFPVVVLNRPGCNQIPLLVRVSI